jgi:hypothetical protein
MGRPLGIAVLLSLPAVLAHLMPGLADWIEYDRAALAAGEGWRVVTCHWAHWSFDHFAWDVAVFAVLAVACALRNGRALAWTLAASAVAIPLAAGFACPTCTRTAAFPDSRRRCSPC